MATFRVGDVRIGTNRQGDLSRVSIPGFGSMRMGGNARQGGVGDYNPDPDRGVDAVLRQEDREERKNGGQRMTGAEMRGLIAAAEQQNDPVRAIIQNNGDVVFQNGTQYTLPIKLDRDAMQIAQQSDQIAWETANGQPLGRSAAPAPQPRREDPVTTERKLAESGEVAPTTSGTAAETKAAPAAPAPADRYAGMDDKQLWQAYEQKLTDGIVVSARNKGIDLKIEVDGNYTDTEYKAVIAARTGILEKTLTSMGGTVKEDGTVTKEEIESVRAQLASNPESLAIFDKQMKDFQTEQPLQPTASREDLLAKLQEIDAKAAAAAAAAKPPAAPEKEGAETPTAGGTLSKAEGVAAKRYNSSTMPDGLAQNQVGEVQKMLVDAGLSVGGPNGGVDEKWGKASQAAFEKICRDAGIDPKAVNFADPQDLETQKFLKAVSERDTARGKARLDFKADLDPVMQNLDLEEETAPVLPEMEAAKAQVAEVQDKARAELKPTAGELPPATDVAPKSTAPDGQALLQNLEQEIKIASGEKDARIVEDFIKSKEAGGMVLHNNDGKITERERQSAAYFGEQLAQTPEGREELSTLIKALQENNVSGGQSVDAAQAQSVGGGGKQKDAGALLA